MQTRNKVLAVDDNLTNIAVMQEILSDDYDVRTAATGNEALQTAVEFQPDIMLLDIMLPDIDGYEVCRQIRANPVLEDTIIIMVSAKGMIEERYKGHEVGADDYITKPFKEDELMESVAFFLKQSANADSSS